VTTIQGMEMRALVNLHPDRRRPALGAGIAMLALAGAALAFPAETSRLVGAACGWLLWLAGALMLGVALLMFTAWLRLLGAAAALVAVGFGIYLTLNPTAGALATALLAAGALVMDGSFQLAAALHLRPLAVWRWLLASALTSLAAGALLAIGLPERTPDAVAVLLAAAFATTGMALIVASFARHAPRRPEP
jgi:uncharacterized membrane protein HdeD (DUF308 family)